MPKCAACGYEIAVHNAARCPECGTLAWHQVETALLGKAIRRRQLAALLLLISTCLALATAGHVVAPYPLWYLGSLWTDRGILGDGARRTILQLLGTLTYSLLLFSLFARGRAIFAIATASIVSFAVSYCLLVFSYRGQWPYNVQLLATLLPFGAIAIWQIRECFTIRRLRAVGRTGITADIERP